MMPQENSGNFEILKEKVEYEGFLKLKKARLRFASLTDDRTLEAELEMVERPDSVAVVLMHRDRNALLLTQQFRYPAHHHAPWLVEIPAGGIENGETPEEAARREVVEELGYQPGDFQRIGTYYSSPGTSSERLIIFYAEVTEADKVDSGGGAASENENILAVEWICDDLEAKMEEVGDAKTMIGLQWLLTNRDPSANR